MKNNCKISAIEYLQKYVKYKRTLQRRHQQRIHAARRAPSKINEKKSEDRQLILYCWWLNNEKHCRDKCINNSPSRSETKEQKDMM